VDHGLRVRPYLVRQLVNTPVMTTTEKIDLVDEMHGCLLSILEWEGVLATVTEGLSDTEGLLYAYQKPILERHRDRALAIIADNEKRYTNLIQKLT